MVEIAWLIGKSFSGWDCSVCECWGWESQRFPDSQQLLGGTRFEEVKKSKLIHCLLEDLLKLVFHFNF